MLSKFLRQANGSRLAMAAGLLLLTSRAMTAPVALDVTSGQNGLYDLYTATFDGPLNPFCGSGASTYCSFFGGDPASPHVIGRTPNPSGLVNVVPGGIGPAGQPVAPSPAPGSFLDLSLSSGNSMLALGVSSITFAPFTLCIYTFDDCATAEVHTVNAGFVLNPTGPANGGALTPSGGGSTGATVAVDGNRRAVFQVQNADAIVADFSSFAQVTTSCTGSVCPLFTSGIYTLDMVRYVLEIQYNSTFTSFTGSFIGETRNGSLIYANLNSVPIPAAFWLLGSALGVLGHIRRRAPSN